MAFKELKVSDWVDEIDRGLKFRQIYGKESNWARVEKLFYNKDDSQANEGPNIIYATGEALLSTVGVPYPYITTKARRMDALMKARVVESIDNMLIDDMGMCEEIEQATLAGYLWGKLILKIGYDSEYGFDELLDIGGVGATLSQFDTKQNRIEYGKVKPGMPWVACVLPHDFVVPWGTRDLETAPWCAHRVIRHVDHVKADPKYERTKDLKPLMSKADHVEQYQRMSTVYRVGTVEPEMGSWAWSSDEPEFVELWEIHDRRTGKIYVTATNYKHFLRNESDPLQVNGLPFVATNFVPSSRNFWVSSDADYILQAQAELTDISLQRNKKRRTDNLKFLYLDKAIDEAELDNVTTAEVGVGIKVNATVPDVRQAIAFLQPPQAMNQGLTMEAEDVRRNARELVGLSSNQYGEYAGGRRSATEANVVQQSASMRLNRRQLAISYLYTKAFSKINPIIFKYWKSPRVAEIIGQDGAPVYLQYTGDALDADYSYKVGFTVEPPETKQQRQQTALMAFQMAMQNPLVDPQGAAKFLASAFNDPEFSAIFKQGVLNGGSAPQPGQGQPQLEAPQAGQQQQGVPLGQDQGGMAAGAEGRF
jgi:hypothetical protein